MRRMTGDDHLVRGLNRIEASHRKAQRRWTRRRNRRAMWNVLGWLAFFFVCIGLLILAGTVLGTS